MEVSTLPSLLNETSSHLKDMMGELKKQLGTLAPVGYGQRERSNQEQAGLWRKITSLPEPEQQAMFSDMAARAGHSPFEETPCEVCRMVARYGLGVK